MARIHVNHFCNVVTGEHSKAYIPPSGVPAPEITVPVFRLRLAVQDAKALGQQLLQAVEVAEAEDELRLDGK